MEHWWLIFISVTCVIFFIFTPFILYYLRQFYIYRKLPIISKRRPQIVIIFSIITLINVLIIRTYFAILSNLSYSGYNVEVYNDSRIRTPAIWLTQLTANLLLCRVWIMFYEWRRTNYLVQLKWSKQLLSQNKTKHWTLKYGYLFGNEKLMIMISSCHYIVGVIACIAAIEVSEGGENGLLYDSIIIIDGLIIMIPFFILSFVSLKYGIHDNYGIRTEIRGVAVIFIVGVVIAAGGAWISKDGVYRSQGSYILTAIISFAIVARLLYVKPLQQHISPNMSLDETMLTRVLRSMSAKNKDDTKVDTQPATKQIQFRDLLKSEEGFKIFADHLLKEFSVEALLFLLEQAQIKRVIIDHYRELFATNSSNQDPSIQDGVEQAIGSMTFHIDIAPQILSLTDDVHKNITIQKVIHLWQYLYQRYIDESSESAINISYNVRERILDCINKHKLHTQSLKRKSVLNTRIFAKNNTNVVDINMDQHDKLKLHNIIMELMEAFGCAAKEVFKLLETDSWLRFRITNEFAMWKKHVKKN